MTLPNALIRNRLFEVGITYIRKPKEKSFERYHKKVACWIDVHGLRFKNVALYVVVKKNCY